MITFTKAQLLGISLDEYCQRHDITLKDLIYKKETDLHILNDHYAILANQEKLTPCEIMMVGAINKERDKVKDKIKEYKKELNNE